MSWDDKTFMARGLRVRHAYRRRHKCHPQCIRCGVKRRKSTSNWEYLIPGARAWTTSNPPCVKR